MHLFSLLGAVKNENKKVSFAAEQDITHKTTNLDRNGAIRLPRLKHDDELHNFGHYVNSYLQQGDVNIIRLSDNPEPGSLSQQRHSFDLEVKSESTITLMLCAHSLVQVSSFVDDDKNAAGDL